MDKKLSDKARILSLKYKYKELVLKKRVKVKTEAARKLVGPDCAYHLYNSLEHKKE